MKTVYLNAAYFPAVELLSAIGTAVILLYGGNQAIDGAIEIGIVVAFVGYLQTFFDPIQQLSQLYTTYQQGMAALDKIFDLLDTEPDMIDEPDALDPGPLRGEIEIDGVSFSYARRRLRARGAGRTGRVGAARRRPRRTRRADPGAGRRDGRRQVDLREAGRPLLRPAGGRGADRRTRPARPLAEALREPARDRAPGGIPVLRHGAREHRLRPPRRASGGDRGRGAPRSGRPSSSPRLPTASRPRSASAEYTSPPASASWSPSRGRCWPSRGS